MARPKKPPDPNAYVSPGKGKGKKGPRPHVWICGPDQYKHQMYVPWMKARAQARFRQEEWTLTFDEYFDLWNGKWHERGRDRDSLCMTRHAWSEAWSKDNAVIIERHEHLRAQGLARRGMTYQRRKTKK
jgi:hypothetical protein